MFLPTGLKLTAALINGSGRTSDDSDGFKDQIYRIGYQTKDKVVSVGGSYYYGQINTSGIPGNLVGTGITGTGSQYTGRKKELYGADAQIVTPFGPFLNAEYVGGLYEQRSFFGAPGATALTTAYAKDNHIDGYYVHRWLDLRPDRRAIRLTLLAGRYDVAANAAKVRPRRSTQAAAIRLYR